MLSEVQGDLSGIQHAKMENQAKNIATVMYLFWGSHLVMTHLLARCFLIFAISNDNICTLGAKPS
jgi:hypothetical protein